MLVLMLLLTQLFAKTCLPRVRTTVVVVAVDVRVVGIVVTAAVAVVVVGIIVRVCVVVIVVGGYGIVSGVYDVVVVVVKSDALFLMLLLSS